MWKKYLALGAAVWMLSGISTVSHASETVSGGQEAETQELENETLQTGQTGTYMPYEGAKYSLRFTVSDNGIVITGISDYESKSDLGELVIPAEINGVAVTTIGRYAFYDCSGLTGDLNIPKGVTTIDERAFYGCSGLTGDLNIPKGVTAIGRYAFYGCSGLTGDLNIPEGVTTIDEGAFSKCSGFTGDLNIPEGVTTIDEGAFFACDGFTGSLNIPKGVTTIGDHAFSWCSGFTGSLNIPKGVTTIGEGAFQYCSGLTGDLNIPEGVTTIEMFAFSHCSGLTGDLNIPEGVTTIEMLAFYFCSGFTGSLNIPKGVTAIGECAFYGCSGLAGDLNIPEGVTTIDERAFYGCSGLTGDLNIPEGVTTIDRGAFYNCSGFTGSLNIPEGVTTIGECAFYGCSGLTGDLNIPKGVTTIDEGAFYNCSGFTGSLNIPKGVTAIKMFAFYNCSGLTGDLNISEEMTTIGESAFSGCSGIKNVTVLGKQTKIPYGLDFAFVHGYSDSVVARDASKWSYTFIPIDAPEITEYRVSTAQELLDAIGAAGEGSYRRIILADGVYNISDPIALSKIVFVTVEAENPGKAEILSQDASKAVITVNQCADVSIVGCVVGYDPAAEQTGTAADLVQIQNSYDVNVKLYGQSITTTVSGVDMQVTVPMTVEEQKQFVSELAAQEGITVTEGAEVTVDITVSDAEGTLAEPDREAVDQSAETEGYKIGRYLDIAMSIQAGANSKQVSHTDEPIRLVIDIPWELRREERIFCLLRLHDGEIVLLKDLDNDPYTITIETDRFSSYTIVYQDASSQGGAISGTLKSFGEASQGALVQLFDSTGNVIAQTTMTGSSGAYELEVVEQGYYTLTVSKAGHVTRSYAVTLDGEALELNAEIRLKGDVNGDGKADSLDKRMIFGHIAGSTTLTGYEFQVGDVDGSGRIDALDKRMIYGHIAGTSPLW